MADVLICDIGTCTEPAQPEHSPCCSSTFHGKSFCCQHYCRTHFVEVGQCTPESHSTDFDAAPCCPDPECNGQPCTFPGYADNH